MQTSQSFTTSHSRLYKVRKKLHIKYSSQKTLKVAKRVQTSPGLPRPLTCEEDFVLEQNKTFSNYLKPTSSFYDLPHTPQKKYSVFAMLKPRDIVGPLETYEKHWKIINEPIVQMPILKKGRSIIGPNKLKITTQSVLFKTETFPIEVPEINYQRPNKLKILYERQKDYWNKLDVKIERRVTVKRLTKKTNFLTIPAQTFNPPIP